MSTTSRRHPAGTRRGGPLTWVRDLRIGVQLVAGGGRSSWVRLVLTAVGVGLGVAVLLVAAAAPGVLTTHDHRVNAREPGANGSVGSASAVLVAQRDTQYRDINVRGMIVQAKGARPAVPPGLTRLPAPGTMTVSPALLRLLSSADGALLRQRLHYRIAGTIGDAGLSAPGEYIFYLGSDRLTNEDEITTSWGVPTPPRGLNPVLLLLAIVGVTALLLPVAVFIAAAVRFGAASRERQQAALRLIGADQQQTRRIAAGEALLGALLGLVAGAGFFLAGRQLTRYVEVDGLGAFPTDLRPDPLLAVLIAVALPTAAVLVTLVALRRVVAEPLRVVRQSADRRRRLLPRLVAPAVGLVLLLTAGHLGQGFRTLQVAVGVLLLLGGTTTLLPWLLEVAVRRSARGTVSWQLAVRRLALDSGPMTRVVAGITVAVAGAIGLQTLLVGVTHQYVTPTGQDPTRDQVVFNSSIPAAAAELSKLTAAFARTPGVRNVLAYSESSVSNPSGDTAWEVAVGDCATLRQLAVITKCSDGDSYLVDGDTPPPEPGTRVPLGSDDPQGWRVPTAASHVTSRTGPTDQLFSGILLTPAAARGISLEQARFDVYLTVDPQRANVYDLVRNVAYRFDPMMIPIFMVPTNVDATFATVRRGLLAGTVAVLLLIGASLLITTLEQLRERRRPLAVLTAFGAQRGVLARSLLWQAAIPVVFGLLLSVTAGTGLGLVLLRMVDEPLWVDWTSIAAIVGAGAAVVLGVTLLSMPALWRLMRPEGMRTE